MIAPDILDKLRREREEQESRNAPIQIPLHVPELIYPNTTPAEQLEEETARIFIIDLA